MVEFYEPREDSALLGKEAEKYAYGDVLDMGTGSGILAVKAAERKEVRKVAAVDINQNALDYCNKTIKNKKIKFCRSDLFSCFKNKNIKFDTIIFNPPYLPQEKGAVDVALYGGKHGYEAIEKFLSQANDFLKDDGMILLLFSSLSKKEKVDGFIRQNLFHAELIAQQHIFFESLFVYKITKTELLKKLSGNGLKELSFFKKGHRGIAYKAMLKKKEVIAKVVNPSSAASGRLEIEAKFLKLLGKKSICPKIFLADKDFIVMEFIDGERIMDYIGKNNKKTIIAIIKKIFLQLRILDKLGIDKEEMHHPFKHIIVRNEKPYLIDFERCHYTENPKNITQFLQFLASAKMAELLEKKNINFAREKMISLAKQYRANIGEKSYRRILNYVA